MNNNKETLEKLTKKYCNLRDEADKDFQRIDKYITENLANLSKAHLYLLAIDYGKASAKRIIATEMIMDLLSLTAVIK